MQIWGKGSLYRIEALYSFNAWGYLSSRTRILCTRNHRDNVCLQEHVFMTWSI